MVRVTLYRLLERKKGVCSTLYLLVLCIYFHDYSKPLTVYTNSSINRLLGSHRMLYNTRKCVTCIAVCVSLKWSGCGYSVCRRGYTVECVEFLCQWNVCHNTKINPQLLHCYYVILAVPLWEHAAVLRVHKTLWNWERESGRVILGCEWRGIERERERLP